MLPVAIAVALVAAAIYLRPCRCSSSSAPSGEPIGLHVSEVKGTSMPTDKRLPPLNLTDAQYAVLSIAAKDQGGVKLPADQFSWASADPTVAELVPVYTTVGGDVIDPGPYGRVLVTPRPGEVDVVVTFNGAGDTNGNTETLPVVIGFSAAGEIGLSAGEPQPE